MGPILSSKPKSAAYPICLYVPDDTTKVVLLQCYTLVNYKPVILSYFGVE
ncbi:unnamed protein product [Prunus armeniaca]